MTSVGCLGSEGRLTDCSHSKLALASCGDGQYAGVKCLGETSCTVNNYEENYFNTEAIVTLSCSLVHYKIC